MATAKSQPGGIPETIGDCRVLRVLAPGRTFLAKTASGREVVLKLLPHECLFKEKLHPSIQERLSRVRELAQKDVANLHGVDRDGEWIVLVWDLLRGATIAEAVAPPLPHEKFLHLARELVLAVEGMHALGIVHGAIKPGNVFVGADRSIQLTHVSPLLHSDPRLDWMGVVTVLQQLAKQRGEAASAAGRLFHTARTQKMPLRDLSARLGQLMDQPPEARSSERTRPSRVDARLRRRSIAAALMMLFIGVIGAGTIWWGLAAPGENYVPSPGELIPLERTDATRDERIR